jgi:hypothetical protein
MDRVILWLCWRVGPHGIIYTQGDSNLRPDGNATKTKALIII